MTMSQEEIRAHLDQVYAGIEMREIKKQLRVEYRPDVAVQLRAALKTAIKKAKGQIPESDGCICPKVGSWCCPVHKDDESNLLTDISR
jgi:hypothetical protein